MPEPDDDSPFAHVPDASAGPIPMQEGPFTYDKMLASTGSGGYAPGARWLVPVLCVVGGLIVTGVIAAWVALALGW